MINLCEGQEMQQVGHCVLLQVKGSGWGAKHSKGIALVENAKV